MRLYVVRHGIAEEEPPKGGDDGARRLTPQGRARLRRIGRALRRLEARVDALVTSPLARAAETAAILVDAHGKLPAPVVCAELAQGVAPLTTVRALASYARRGDLMIVGHEPGLSRVVAVLLTGSPDGVAIELKKGGCALLELDRLAPRHARLVWSCPPRVLRLAGRKKKPKRQWGSTPPG